MKNNRGGFFACSKKTIETKHLVQRLRNQGFCNHADSFGVEQQLDASFCPSFVNTRFVLKLAIENWDTSRRMSEGRTRHQTGSQFKAIEGLNQRSRLEFSALGFAGFLAFNRLHHQRRGGLSFFLVHREVAQHRIVEFECMFQLSHDRLVGFNVEAQIKIGRAHV